MRNKCYICCRPGKKGLCKYHAKQYLWDSSIKGFRLKKRLNGSRYTKMKFHKNEIKLTKICEDFYGPSNIVTSYHPIWAVTDKGALYEYDIYVTSENILIEYNGIQHYEFTPFFHKTMKTFNGRLSKDTNKKKLANTNNAKLVIFSYKEPVFEDYVVNKLKNGEDVCINSAKAQKKD